MQTWRLAFLYIVVQLGGSLSSTVLLASDDSPHLLLCDAGRPLLLCDLSVADSGRAKFLEEAAASRCLEPGVLPSTQISDVLDSSVVGGLPSVPRMIESSNLFSRGLLSGGLSVPKTLLTADMRPVYAFEVISYKETFPHYGIRLSNEVNGEISDYFYTRQDTQRFGFWFVQFGAHSAKVIKYFRRDGDTPFCSILFRREVEKKQYTMLQKRLDTDVHLSDDTSITTARYYYHFTHIVPTGGKLYFSEMTYIQNIMCELLSLRLEYDNTVYIHDDKKAIKDFEKALLEKRIFSLEESGTVGDYSKLSSLSHLFQTWKR